MSYPLFTTSATLGTFSFVILEFSTTETTKFHTLGTIYNLRLSNPAASEGATRYLSTKTTTLNKKFTIGANEFIRWSIPFF